MNIKTLQYFMHDIAKRAITHDIVAYGSQMAFFMILSFFPFLIFFLTFMSYMHITGDVALWNLAQYLPPEINSIAKEIISQLLQNRSGTLLSFGVLATIWAATNAMEAMIKGIKKTYNIKATDDFFRLKVISLFYTIAISLVFLFSFIMVVFGDLIAINVAQELGFNDTILSLWNAFRYIVPSITMLVVFMIVYYYIPGIRQKPKDILPGAVFSSAGWLCVSELFSYYVNHFASYSTTYGSLGGAIALLVWIYWCGLLILLGSEINASIYFAKYGSHKVLRTSFDPKIPFKIIFPKRVRMKKGYLRSRYRLLQRIQRKME